MIAFSQILCLLETNLPIFYFCEHSFLQSSAHFHLFSSQTFRAFPLSILVGNLCLGDFVKVYILATTKTIITFIIIIIVSVVCVYECACAGIQIDRKRTLKSNVNFSCVWSNVLRRWYVSSNIFILWPIMSTFQWSDFNKHTQCFLKPLTSLYAYIYVSILPSIIAETLMIRTPVVWCWYFSQRSSVYISSALFPSSSLHHSVVFSFDL